MKKVIAVCLSLVLLIGTFTGCQKSYPDEKETRDNVKDIVCGESFKLEGDSDHYTVHSKDRDLEFDVWWAKGWDDITYGIRIPNGEFDITNNYDTVVHHFWFDEYCRCIDRYGFYNVNYGYDIESKARIDSPEDPDYCSPASVWIYMDEDSDPEDIKKIESLMRDLRDICRKEDEYHTSDTRFYYSVYLTYKVGEKEFMQSDSFKISKDSADEELKVDNFEFSGRTNSIGPGISGNGCAVITVYED